MIKLSSAQNWEGPEVCEMLRIPHCLDSQLTDVGKVVNRVHKAVLMSQKHIFVSDMNFY
jgi:hypothetical protein